MSFLSKISGIRFSIKGIEANRAAMPRGGGYYGGSGGWYGELLDAMRGINARQSGIDFRKEAGDLRCNSIVSICTNWIATSWAQAPARVGKMRGDEFKPLPQVHPAERLLLRPNPRYGGRWLNWALQSDYWPAGNAYVHIVRTGAKNLTGDIVELEYLPESLIEPKPGSDGRLEYFEYGPDRREFDPREIVHHRFGIDPRNPLKGLSPLLAQDRYIVADNSGGAYSAGLLLHGGLPPALLVPEVVKESGLAARPLSKDDAEVLTETLSEKFRNEPGKVRFLSNAVKLLMLGYKPSEMALNDLMEEPETRIPAAFGIPPEVIKLRVGMKSSTENNIRLSQRSAWTDCIAPTQDIFAEVWTTGLVEQYPDGDGLVCSYDRSGVGVLQEDETQKRADARADLQAGIITIEEARAAGGRETSPKVMALLDMEKPKPAATDAAAPEPGKKSAPPILSRKDSGSTLESAAARYRADLLAREDSAVADMTAAWEAAQTRIQARLNALIERMETAKANGETISESWLFQERRYRELLEQIDEAMAEFAGKAAPDMTDAQQGFVDAATEHAPALASAAAGADLAGLGVSWNALPVGTVEALVGFASDGSPLAALLKEVGGKHAQDAREVLIAGVAAGVNPREIARDFEAITGITRARALNICRTETLRAARTASIQSFAANQDIVTGWIWHSARDVRTCASCWAMHGSFHSLAESLDDHCQGRCAAVPRTKSLADITGDPTIPDSRPTIDAGSDLFAALSEDEQKAILGPGLHEHYAAGRVTLSDCVQQTSSDRWGTMRRAATIEEALANAAARGQS